MQNVRNKVFASLLMIGNFSNDLNQLIPSQLKRHFIESRLETTTHSKFEYAKCWSRLHLCNANILKVFNVNLCFWCSTMLQSKFRSTNIKMFGQLKFVMLNLIATNVQQCNEFVQNMKSKTNHFHLKCLFAYYMHAYLMVTKVTRVM